MIEKIKSALSECGVSLWRITESQSQTAELYFIKKQLDIPRLKDLTVYVVEVFRDFEENGVKFRGSSNALLSPGMKNDEIVTAIKSAYFSASFIRNKWFELPAPVKAEHIASDSDIASKDLKDVVKLVADGIFEIDTEVDAFLNSVEIFASKISRRIIASTGLDVSFDKCTLKGELVAQCVTPKDVEQFRDFEYDSLNIKGLQQRALDAIRDVRARARSTELPDSGSYSVLLKGEHIAEVLSYYTARSSAHMIYPGYSKWQVGMNIQGAEVEKEKLSLTLLPADPYSSEGIPMPVRPLIRDGKLETIQGSARFCYYLGVEPTGVYGKVSCENGTVPLSELEGEGVLEPVSFSDFQMDIMDGHFKGEIRLALLHHADGTVEELSGGSINGCITDAQGRLLFSTERYCDSSYDGPLAMLVPDVSVAGK